MIAEGDVEVSVCYGLGASCLGRFPRRLVGGLPAREVVQKVLESPQPTESAARTVRVLSKVVRSGRPIDVELSSGPDDGTSPGKPIALDDVVVPERRDDIAPQSDKVTVLLSEAYRGG